MPVPLKKKLSKSAGTLGYIAPEVLEPFELNEMYEKIPRPYDGKKADIYSLGITFFNLYFRDHAFEKEGEKVLRKLFD